MRFRIRKIEDLKDVMPTIEGHIESEKGKTYFVVDSLKRKVKA